MLLRISVWQRSFYNKIFNMNTDSFFKLSIVAIFSSLMVWLMIGSLDGHDILPEDSNVSFNPVQQADIPEVADQDSELELEAVDGSSEVSSEEDSVREFSKGDSRFREWIYRNEALTDEPLEAITAKEETVNSDRLTVEGVVYYTNQERSKEGVRSLIPSEKLNAAAKIKLDSMFEVGYFAHEDPDGGMCVNVLSGIVDYNHIIIGENLAMGNFKNDEDLVAAWMDSPGHRLNIIKDRYSEIGVAVGRGEFEGKEVWMAVQIFGMPISDCPLPDPQLEASIKDSKEILDVLLKEIGILEKELNENNFLNRDEYLRTVDHYNSLVKRYNGLLEETKLNIEKHNAQIDVFNGCAKS